MHDSRQWDPQLLASIFEPQLVQSITTTPVHHSMQDDTLRWLLAINGKCTTKTAYSYLASQQQHNLPLQGSRNLSPQANTVLQKVWKAKLIPPFLKTFAWSSLEEPLFLLRELLDIQLT
jgi:hypothetical protein